jgi:hypothetical protein
MQDAEQVVRRFWALMQGNDFGAVGAVLADDFTLGWPQSGERIRGRANFAAMNAAYPAHGAWRFEVLRLVAQPGAAVTETDITDGVQRGRAITFFELRGDRIARIVEYWPEPFAARPDRAQWVERMAEGALG